MLSTPYNRLTESRTGNPAYSQVGVFFVLNKPISFINLFRKKYLWFAEAVNKYQLFDRIVISLHQILDYLSQPKRVD